MQKTKQKRWLAFWAAFCAILMVGGVCAQQITLVAKVSYSLLNAASNAPLADGSVVYIIGSLDNTINDMVSYGTGYVANSTTGDDVFIGAVTIGTGKDSNGTFQANFSFVDADVDYMYLRFFDTTMNPPNEIYTNWNVSPMFAATNHPFGVLFLDFVGHYAATNADYFVVIPEPGTGFLLLACAGLMFGLRASIRGKPGKT